MVCAKSSADAKRPSVSRTSTAPFRAGLCLVWAGLGPVASALWAAGGDSYHPAA